MLPNRNSVFLSEFYARAQVKIYIHGAIHFGVFTWLALECVIA